MPSWNWAKTVPKAILFWSPSTVLRHAAILPHCLVDLQQSVTLDIAFSFGGPYITRSHVLGTWALGWRWCLDNLKHRILMVAAAAQSGRAPWRQGFENMVS